MGKQFVCGTMLFMQMMRNRCGICKKNPIEQVIESNLIGPISDSVEKSSDERIWLLNWATTTISKKIVFCSNCKYCGPRRETYPGEIADIINRTGYRIQLEDPNYPTRVNYFLCDALINERTHNYLEAAWSYFYAAMCCDEDSLFQQGDLFRTVVIELIDKVLPQKDWSITEQICLIVKIDLLRRLSRFDEAAKQIKLALKGKTDYIINCLLMFEKKLISNKETKAYPASTALGAVQKVEEMTETLDYISRCYHNKLLETEKNTLNTYCLINENGYHFVTNDLFVQRHLSQGIDHFTNTIIDGLSKAYPGEFRLNRCSKCHSLAHTPRVRNCYNGCYDYRGISLPEWVIPGQNPIELMEMRLTRELEILTRSDITNSGENEIFALLRKCPDDPIVKNFLARIEPIKLCELTGGGYIFAKQHGIKFHLNPVNGKMQITQIEMFMKKADCNFSADKFIGCNCILPYGLTLDDKRVDVRLKLGIPIQAGFYYYRVERPNRTYKIRPNGEVSRFIKRTYSRSEYTTPVGDVYSSESLANDHLLPPSSQSFSMYIEYEIDPTIEFEYRSGDEKHIIFYDTGKIKYLSLESSIDSK